MTIVARDDAGVTVLAVRDCFDAGEADALHEVLSAVEPWRAVTIDFRAARHIEDFAVARLARDLALRPLLLVGLSEHHHRILRYLDHEAGGRPPPGLAAVHGREPGPVPLVLVVEDDCDVRAILSDFLSGEGYEVHETADPGDAVRHTAEHRPAAVLLDVMMPRGSSILERLRAAPVAARVPVVVISESRTPPEGACAALREPFELDALASTLASVRAGAVQ